ncbi:response regulator [Mangrovihabitans endophyticus]|uniref:Response regulatory domain-containing protein n=1 Tax=Mangrovihabitans endophyticus TaxID=1751298 RepID=A0A8J3C3Y1_9ACTN|nr:response regulator [Mangrovihabitans endophyticus]GGL06917.1 hypothetical protein GCM10012284_46380 [Mangrovihabitans endophyticus]GGL06944.1 hypothetical protein GCM10012284_46420 [Mangrovihabitans endophyticus]
MAEDGGTRVLLLVEDNRADAELVKEYLAQSDDDDSGIRVIHVSRRDDAAAVLQRERVDVILLDLTLPDARGLRTLESIRDTAGDVPIVVLTGAEEDGLAASCLDAGAQDYLLKFEIRPVALRRAVGYAIYRKTGEDRRSLAQVFAQYREMSSQNSTTMVTASMAGTGALRMRYPDGFDEIVGIYQELVVTYVDCLFVKQAKPRVQMEEIVTLIGDRSGGPRDLLDVHVAALDRVTAAHEGERARAIAVEGRLMALEMMGMLVEFYRVGQRRHMAWSTA